MKTAKYFQDIEFRRCTPSCSIEDMEQDFLDLLDNIRVTAGIPLVLTCAYRSSAYDKSKDRSGKGAHTFGVAVDIRCNTDSNRYKIISAALKCGVTRIGIGKGFVHIDAGTRAQGLSEKVCWTYY